MTTPLANGATVKVFTQTAPPDHPGFAFRLSGTTLAGDEWHEDFMSVPPFTLPAGCYVDLAVGAEIADGEVRYRTQNVLRFIRSAIAEDEPKPTGDDQVAVSSRLRFDLLIRDPKRRVQTEMLGEVCMWLTEVLTTHPSGGQPNSPGGLSASKG